MARVRCAPAVPCFSPAVQPEWRTRALKMLRVTSPHLLSATGVASDRNGCSGIGDPEVVPLYELGSKIGEGCSSVVVQVTASVRRPRTRQGAHAQRTRPAHTPRAHIAHAHARPFNYAAT